MPTISFCNIRRSVIVIVLLTISYLSFPQYLDNVIISAQDGLFLDSLTLSDKRTLNLIRKKPLVSFFINSKNYTSDNFILIEGENISYLTPDRKVKLTCEQGNIISSGWCCDLVFENLAVDSLTISNVVPFSNDNESVIITGRGSPELDGAWIFRPGFNPLRVILPDNAWEMGYSSFKTDKGFSVCAVARRINTEGGQLHKHTSVLPPGAIVQYRIFADLFTGEWQNGLRLMFRDRFLFDIEEFDNSLYERSDLAWIKECYIMVLQMAWDREFYDRMTNKYTYPEILKMGVELFGNIDIFGIWPTWPRLGLDQRNQWDMFRDLPGGTRQINIYTQLSHQTNTKFFVAYNPWDNSTRKQDNIKRFANLIRETDADGVILNTSNNSGLALQTIVDSIRKGIVIYPERITIPGKMPGIISGRIHEDIFLSPELNLNKLIKPDYTIFRVCNIGEGIFHRELTIAFFNGYGVELNMFRPGGRDDNFRTDLEYLARTTFILRQNNDAFLDTNWTPLIETLYDNVYVNRWNHEEKTLFTVLNMRPEGIDGKLFKIEPAEDRHFVSLWYHEDVTPIKEKGNKYLTVKAEAWPESFSGTRKEGSVDCIAEFPVKLKTCLRGDSIFIQSPGSGNVIIWKGDPSYRTIKKELGMINDTVLKVNDIFGYYEGKIVIQLIENKRLEDENILFLKGGKPWLISKVIRTIREKNIPDDMVLVPGADFSFDVTTDVDFIPYPEVSNLSFNIDTFLIDRYPVTNAQYYEFLVNSGYRPSDTVNYLSHWQSGIYRQGQDNYPVVYLSYEDMRAYATWTGKRLPTEAEWQLAAQGTDKRKWPWGDEFHGTFCNNAFNRQTPVDAFPKGASPYGVMDMVGNIWQMTNDMYFNGSNYFMVIRGGSYYHPGPDSRYVQGGPQPLNKTQILLMVSPGFDRNATVGFRCVKDIDKKAFKPQEGG